MVVGHVANHDNAAVSVAGAGSMLRAERCRFEGGADGGIRVEAGGAAELLDCSLALTAKGLACFASMPGSSAVLGSCRVEGCATAPSAAGQAGGPGRKAAVPLAAVKGASLTLESCALDVDGVVAAASSRNPGAGAGRVGCTILP